MRDELIGKTVLAFYGNFRMYRIDDIDFKRNPTTNWKLGTPEKGTGAMNFIQYYKEKYNITIKAENQPLLIHIDKKAKNIKNQEISLIPELCRMTGITDQMKSDFRCMKAVSEKTKLHPNDRMKEIYEVFLTIISILYII